MIAELSVKATRVGEKSYFKFLFITVPYFTVILGILTLMFCVLVPGGMIEGVFKKRKRATIMNDVKSMWKSYKDVYKSPYFPYKALTPARYNTWQARHMLANLTQ